MRRLITVLIVVAAGVAVYRQRRLARSEQELALARDPARRLTT